MLNSHDLALLRLPDRALDRDAVADLPAEPLREVDADDRALAVGEPGLHLLGRQLELRIDLQERLGLDRDLREEVRRVLVDAAEPGVVRGHRRRLGVALQPLQVRDRQRHDQADLVDQHQPIEAGDVDAEA